jgi:hypothetical protein
MTNAQKNIRQIEKILNQYADGWVFIGFDPTSGDSMMAGAAPDHKTAIALNALMGGLLQNGGVGALLERIKEKEQEEGDSET